MIKGVIRSPSHNMLNKTLFELFEQSAKIYPHLDAVVDERMRFSYREFDALVNRAHRFLREEAQLRPGEVVALRVDRNCYALAFILAIMKAGCTYLPLGDKHVSKCDFIDILLTDKWKVDSIPEGTRHFFLSSGIIERIFSSGSDHEVDSTRFSGKDSNVPAYVMFTSGSTGDPKGVAVCDHSVVNTIDWVNREYNICSKDRILCVTPFSFDLSIYDIFGAFSVGASVRIASEREVKSVFDVVDILVSEPVSIWNSAPSYFRQVIDLVSVNIGQNVRLRQIFLSGDWVRPHLIEEIQGKIPSASVAVFGGATEASIWSNYHNIPRRGAYEAFIPYGRPIQNCSYLVLRDDLTVCANNEIGNLFISGQCLAKGYINDEGLTCKKYIELPSGLLPGQRCYDTGDLARILPTGEIQLIGRRDSQIKVRGVRIELGEIETLLLKSKFIRDVICTGEPSGGGDVLIVVHVFAPELSDAELLGTVKHLFEEQTPSSMWPSAIRRLVDVTLNKNGKTDRAASIKHSISLSTSSPIEACTETEKAIQSFFQKYTNNNAISLAADFFFSGGNSLTASLLASSIQNRFPFSGFSVAEVYKYRTISKISRIIDAGATCKREEEHVSGEIPVSIGYISPIESSSSQAFHNLVTCEFFIERGVVDLDKLKEAVSAVYNSHDAFRITLTPGAVIRAENSSSIGSDCRADPFVEFSTSIEELRSNILYEQLPKLFSPLDQSSLLKFIIMHVAGSNHDRCVLMVHHWVIDGFSMCLLLREISEFYNRTQDLQKIDVKASSILRWNERKRIAYMGRRTIESNYWLMVERERASLLMFERGNRNSQDIALIPRSVKRTFSLIAANGALNQSQISDYWELLNENVISHSHVSQLTCIARKCGVTFQELVMSAVTEAVCEIFQSDSISVNVYQASRYSHECQLDGGRVIGNTVVRVPFVAKRPSGRDFLTQSQLIAEEFRAIPASGIIYDQFCMDHQLDITAGVFLDLNFVPKEISYEPHLLIPGSHWELIGEKKGVIINRSVELDDDRRIYVQINEDADCFKFHVCINGYYRIDDLHHNPVYCPEVQFAISQTIIKLLMSLLEDNKLQ